MHGDLMSSCQVTCTTSSSLTDVSWLPSQPVADHENANRQKQKHHNSSSPARSPHKQGKVGPKRK